MFGRALPESKFAITIVSALLTVGGRRRWPADGTAASHTERPGIDSDTVDRRHPSHVRLPDADSGGPGSRRRRPTAPTGARQVTSVGPDVLGLPARRAAARQRSTTFDLLRPRRLASCSSWSPTSNGRPLRRSRRRRRPTAGVGADKLRNVSGGLSRCCGSSCAPPIAATEQQTVPGLCSTRCFGLTRL